MKGNMEKQKRRIVTIERIIILVIILGVATYFIISNGLLNKNSQEEFVFNWDNSTIKTFVNNEIAPYCITASAGESEWQYIGILESKYCYDQDTEKQTTPTLWQQILKFEDSSSAYSALEKLKADVISQKQFKNFYLIETENQSIYAGEMYDINQIRYVYFWNVNKYVFAIIGSETFKTKKLTQWIVEQYTGEKEISLNKTKEIFTLECGDRICSLSINEDCNSCTKDCSCQFNQQCVRKTYGEGYECRTSQGNYCSFNTDCAEGHCVHNYCRTKSTYCGDTYCDNYDSENPENCGNCLNDCFCGSDKQCINNECKVSLNSYCSYSSECASGYCVHSYCRSSSTYCGDYYCDYPETKSTCSSDCNT